jgi:catechol 2,3-dioxygenase-like lactoylglutathione lyase family enzyme
MTRGFTPRALGEIAIRCRNYEAMVAFYESVLGLTVLPNGRRPGPPQRITFFHLGESFGGHTAVLALFEDSAPKADAHDTSALHHIALSLPWAEQDAAKAWLEDHGLPARFQEFDWVGWRGLFTQDPDGNTVELVAASAKAGIE